jgi:uncharacterized protein
MSADVQVQRAELGLDGAFYVERDGERLAEQVYRKSADGKSAIIVHTEVAELLRGEGIARKLTLAAVAWARASGVKLVPVCPFARAVFEHDPTLHDVLE